MSSSDDHVLVNDLHGEYLQVLANVQLSADRTECHLLKACQSFFSHVDSSVGSTVVSRGKYCTVLNRRHAPGV